MFFPKKDLIFVYAYMSQNATETPKDP